MSSTALTAGTALLAGVDLVVPVTIVATAFLTLSMVFFAAIAIGPYVSPGTLTEDQKNTMIALGAALAGLAWMVIIMRAASLT